jgi:hypothetical protein
MPPAVSSSNPGLYGLEPRTGSPPVKRIVKRITCKKNNLQKEYVKRIRKRENP